MHNDRRGMTAFMDAIVFILVIMVALSVTINHISGDDGDYPNASVLMDAVYSTTVLSSDISSMEYDVRTGLVDMVAYSLVSGDEGPLEYLSVLMDSHCRGHGYLMEIHYDGSTREIGSPGDVVRSSAEKGVNVEGRYLWMKFSVMS